ncbi:hypothetical protein [Streptomyces amritsarensis]|uniref:hypothetical protein n=1 Tax=Streptomyces amritsarensis TaxID=681158 RepID=UPI0036CF0FD4
MESGPLHRHGARCGGIVARAEGHSVRLRPADGEGVNARSAKATDGTRWTNKQLLWHMLFGCTLVRALFVLARLFGRLPRTVSKVFAWLLNAATIPFALINYVGPCGAAKVHGPWRIGAAFDRVIASLHRRPEAETEAGLARGMHHPRDSAAMGGQAGGVPE